MSIQKFKSGTNQDDRVVSALKPEYVSVEERSAIDLLKYSRKYAEDVRYFSGKGEGANDSFWTSFLDFDDDELTQLVEFSENPDLFKDDETVLANYSKPHLAMLMAFLRLLEYPKEKFADLTGKKLEYFYRNVLKLEERDEVPDQAHVVFELAQDVKEKLLEKGTLFYAGKDETGADLHFEATEDIVINKTQVSDVRTLHFKTAISNIKHVHLAAGRGDKGFEEILCLSTGEIESLPDYYTAYGEKIPVDGKYLRQELYERIRGLEKDDLTESDARYVFESLCFKYMKDFRYCLDIYYREMNRGYVGVEIPEENEWEKVYDILQGVNTEKTARARRQELTDIHKDKGFDSMMEYAFGEPDPWNMLYKMPGDISTLEELFGADTEAARKYIEEKLCMSADDFNIIMKKKDATFNQSGGLEVYTLLEEAWTRKRGFVYPVIGSQIVEGFQADTVFSSETGDGNITRFKPFGDVAKEESQNSIDMGFAVSSPLLEMREGKRQVEMVLSCKPGTIPHEEIKELIEEKSSMFQAFLTTENGWIKADHIKFETGKFTVGSEQKSYDRTTCFPVCDVLDYDVFNEQSVGSYLVFESNQAYRIERYEHEKGRIILKSVGLEFEAEQTRLITDMIPTGFVDELKASVEAGEYDSVLKIETEIFDEYFTGKYFVDAGGKIFSITSFISASEIGVNYCGKVSNPDDLLVVNRVWETIEPVWADTDGISDIGAVSITGIYSERGIFDAEDPVQDLDILAGMFDFEVSDNRLVIRYPEGIRAEHLIFAWNRWLEDPAHDTGRFKVEAMGDARWSVSSVSKDIEKTGEVVKRFESSDHRGISISYTGRPNDISNLIIEEPSDSNDNAEFSIADGLLTIIPGAVSKTANQITADWQLWLENDANNCAGFNIESRDEHLWEANEVEQVKLAQLDKVIKVTDIHDSNGNGIRVLYTGSESHRPKVEIKENSTGLFEFEVEDKKKIAISYPNGSAATALDLLDAWCAWKNSELNDPGDFEIERLGDGVWIVAGRTECELKTTESQIMECAIDEIGIIARFQLNGEYLNAAVELIEGEKGKGFSFSFDDTTYDDKKTSELTITYPPLILNADGDIQQFYQDLHVQELLKAWSRVYSKKGFTIVRKGDALWSTESFDDPLIKNFLVDLSYVATVHPDGFKVKYRPSNTSQTGRVVVVENDSEMFEFHQTDDYLNNIKILFIKYPTKPEKRTVEELLIAWEVYHPVTDPVTEYEFSIEQSGMGKWDISAVTEKELTSDITDETELTDPENQRFFEYRTEDISGYEIRYAGPYGFTPKLTVLSEECDQIDIDVDPIFDEYHDLNIDSHLIITVPENKEKRKTTDLLKAWREWKKTARKRFRGFEIIDFSPGVNKRSETPLLITGDEIREYSPGAGDGIRVTYTGHREDVQISLEPVVTFTDADIDRNLLWDNGQVYAVTERLDCNNILVDAAGSMDLYGEINQYESDALCFNAMKFAIDLEENFLAVTGLEGGRPSLHPSVKIMLNSSGTEGTSSDYARFYELFKSVCMERVDLNVHVKGLTDIAKRNDIAVINSNKVFDPFGITPDSGSGFYFANKEICEKKLDSLNLNLNWDQGDIEKESGVPDMADHYFAWSRCGQKNIGTIKNRDFQVGLEFLDQRTWQQVSGNAEDLFCQSIEYSNFSKQTYQGDMFGLSEDTPKDPRDWSRYFRLTLSNQGFMKSLQDDVETELIRAANSMILAENSYDAAKKEIEARDAVVKAGAEAANGEDSYNSAVVPGVGDLPLIPENDRDISSLAFNRAYTPRLKSISLDYSASSCVVLDGSDDKPDYMMVPSKLFRFHPFGFSETVGTGEDDFLLPQYDKQGYIYIGLKDLKPLQNVSILVQMISGSGDANLSIPEVNWSYCASNVWKPFSNSDILMDRTNGMQDTGIIRFRIPEDATDDNTVLPGGRCWIRGEAEDKITACPDILDLKAQSLSVQYVNRANDPMRLETPLEAESITSLVERDPAIKEITQPYSSFDGYKREDAQAFQLRVSEILRHKNRALTLSDYEKIILAEFPGIYKVKCLPQNEMKILDHECEGEVRVIVILKNEKATPFYPLKPKTPAGVLEEVGQFLKECMPPLVSIDVTNPGFEEVRYRMAVKFRKGHDRGFSMNRLNEDIMKFLSPWAYRKEEDVSFGSTVYSSSVINHIERLDYVDYIANFTLLEQVIVHDSYREVIPLFLTKDNAASVKYPDSILVSAEEHMIDVIETEYYDAGAFRGIGYMNIGTDFWVSTPGPVFSVGIGEMELEVWPVPRYVFNTVPVTISATGVVNGENYVIDDLSTLFTNESSQKLWNALKKQEYIDSYGKVTAKGTEVHKQDLLMPLNLEFEEYLKINLATFTFDLKATDFNPDAEDNAIFSYTISEVKHSDTLETDVTEILRDMDIKSIPVPTDVFSTVPVTINVKGIVNGENFVINDLSTFFTSQSSRKIWNALKKQEYIDSSGKVTVEDTGGLHEPDFKLTMPGDQLFTDYLIAQLSSFTFDLDATDFKPDAVTDATFSYTVSEVKFPDIVESDVIGILLNGEGFDGLSQYPFVVY
ncbi:MAG: hypothetical protein GY714_02440 [Desulfobacterales bacterium]|nr:hypothetical protein [Desulfobacterales bacterium]